jgi:hypothetical protein
VIPEHLPDPSARRLAEVSTDIEDAVVVVENDV